MKTIRDIRIESIDQDKPPLVRKEAYIDLYFKLSQKAPTEWCEDFNKLGHQIDPPAKIDKLNGLVVETWVRDMDHIQEHLDKIKQKILLCNESFLTKLSERNLAMAARNASVTGQDGAQNKLNQIIAKLDFRAS